MIVELWYDLSPKDWSTVIEQSDVVCNRQLSYSPFHEV